MAQVPSLEWMKFQNEFSFVWKEAGEVVNDLCKSNLSNIIVPKLCTSFLSFENLKHGAESTKIECKCKLTSGKYISW